jgi:hypothetical protein
MKPWQIDLEAALSGPGAPPVLTRDLLARFARSAREGSPLAASSLSHWLKIARAREKLLPIVEGLYLNNFRARAGTLADAAPVLRVDAVVSLNTALADAGVLNNPSHVVTAIVPIDAGAPPPKLGQVMTKAGTLQFFGVPRRHLEAGAAADRLFPEGRFEHPRATPEKALLDWLYLARSPRSRRTPPPRGDIDLDRMALPRLKRLGKAMDQEAVLAAWLG